MTCQYMAQGMSKEEASEKFREWERDKILKYGWLVHFCNDAAYLTGANYHTHGLPENFDHPDLQIVMPLPEKTAHSILVTMVERIKAGENFVDGELVSEVIKKFDVKLIDAKEDGRPVLRIVLPDPNGNLERWNMEEPYFLQYEEEQELTDEELKYRLEGEEGDEE